MLFRKNKKMNLALTEIDNIFNDFCSQQLNQHIIKQNEMHIIKQVCSNECVPFKHNKIYTDEELQKIKQGLQDIIYINANGLTTIIENGDELEKINLDGINDASDEDLHRIARNLFRYLYRGTVINGEDNAYKEGLNYVEKNIHHKREPRFLAILREEMKKMLAAISKQLVQQNNLNNAQEKRLNIFIDGLLSSYALLDPVENEMLQIPQKIDNKWILISYRVNRIDISPHAEDNALTSLVKEEDRIYVYTLTPGKEYSDIVLAGLLFPGTTYPTGQGATLSQIYNYVPGLSVGEGHDLQLVRHWIKNSTRRIWITGHSKGGTMAMIVAAEHPDKIERAECLNPAALCHETLQKLSLNWNRLKPSERPAINVYAQLGDIVFEIDAGFLPGTHLYRVMTEKQHCSTLKWYVPHFFQAILESHLHHFSGYNNVLFLKINTDVENARLSRLFSANFKAAINRAWYPPMYNDYKLSLLGDSDLSKIQRKIWWPIHTHLTTATLVTTSFFYSCVIAALQKASVNTGRQIKNTEEQPTYKPS